MQAIKQKIWIKNLDFGFFNQKPVTVQRFEQDIDDPTDKNLVWCNHAGAIEEIIENEIPRMDQPDLTWTSRIMVCDKANCGAFKQEGQDYWEDAPYEGVSHV